MSILRFVFETVINFYQGFMEIHFIDSVLEPKRKEKNIRHSLAFSGLMGLLITILNQITIFEGIIGMALYYLLLLIYSLKFFKDNKYRCFLASIIPLIVLTLISLISINYISMINNMTIEEIVKTMGLPRITLLMLTQIMFFIVLKVLAKLFGSKDELFNNVEIIISVIVFASSIVLACMLQFIAIDYVSQKQRTIINLSIVVIAFINIILLILLSFLKRKNYQLKCYELNELHKGYQKIYIDEAKSQYDTIMKIRHDIKNQLDTIYRLIEVNEYEEAKRFIADNQMVVKKVDTKIYTNNDIVNAVINSKMTAASALGIDVLCCSVNDFAYIYNIDWCNLLSNMIDNAINACLDLSDDIDKRIEISISKNDKSYIIVVSNTIEKSVLQNNPGLVSSNADKVNHGFGIQIIRDIAQKYNGNCIIYEENSSFYCKVILNI